MDNVLSCQQCLLCKHLMETFHRQIKQANDELANKEAMNVTKLMTK